MAGDIKEITVISGKGGTGKTSLTASFAVLAQNAVMADCDVDAADLHLLLSPEIRQEHNFQCGRLARIVPERCTGCGLCLRHCRFGAVTESEGKYAISSESCEGCGVCVRVCPAGAVDFPERECGRWMVSDTRCGPMVHARLSAAAENSGKLVSIVRGQARMLAQETGRRLLITDGPPGIGCPVIASLTGASLALIVTEPTVSGEHDLMRVLSLAGHFKVPTAVCVNKWDLNPEMAERIEKRAGDFGARIAGRIGYDPGVTKAQIEARTVVETETPSAGDIRAVWRAISNT
jgi:MinD superfamily P-loop ATPase